MPSQAERRALTRSALIGAARRLFLKHGIDPTSTAQILQAAGVSRGGMYHHFASREDLVAAVYEEVAAATIAVAAVGDDPTASAADRLVGAADRWISEALRPEVARILAIDGPAALGWTRCREIEGRHALGALRALVTSLMRSGQLRQQDPTVVAHLLNAVIGEAALLLHHSHPDRRGDVRREVEQGVRSVVRGFLS